MAVITVCADKRQKLPPTGEALWQVIQTLDGEFTRQELAATLGKRQLSSWDKELLERLVTGGFLEVEEQQVKNLIRLVYRLPKETP